MIQWEVTHAQEICVIRDGTAHASQVASLGEYLQGIVPAEMLPGVREGADVSDQWLLVLCNATYDPELPRNHWLPAFWLEDLRQSEIGFLAQDVEDDMCERQRMLEIASASALAERQTDPKCDSDIIDGVLASNRWEQETCPGCEYARCYALYRGFSRARSCLFPHAR